MWQRTLKVGALAWWLTLNVVAEPLAPVAVPEPLKPWLPWVLHDTRDLDCPFLFNAESRRCAWPGRLALELNAAGGRFTFQVEAFAKLSLPLPGRAGQWPQAVTIDGLPAIVTTHQGTSAVDIQPGSHEIVGRFEWPDLPETLQVPTEIGLISLSVNNVATPLSNFPLDGQLWLRTPEPTTSVTEDRLEIQVYRQVIDELPLQVVTQLELDVAGNQREIALAGPQLPGTVAMVLESPFPARLEATGELRLQLKPGHWSVRLTTRHLESVTSLPAVSAAAPWPAEEIWVFAARTALRVVEVQGGTVIDPRQTQLPLEWQELPAYRLTAGEALSFAEQRRGDPEPEPDQLSLNRQLWLDFDGGGYTINDTISGQMTHKWRLEAGPSLDLGRVSLNGQPQFITSLDAQRRGVEVRRGAVDLAADSRAVGGVNELAAVGWAQDMNALSMTLNLPPGWRLWSARGVDNVPDTWLHRWTLLDLFLVLIATVAVARLWHWRWAALALMTLALIWHEPGAPRQIWLHLLAAVALLRVLPSGRLRGLATGYRNGALLVLAATVVIFMIAQVRLGLYPQLEFPYQAMDGAAAAPMAAPASANPELQESLAASQDMPAMEGAVQLADEGRASYLTKRGGQGVGALLSSDYDPKANIQTGPGLPNWRWQAVQLTWNGPVAQSQTLGLVLLSPAVNLGLSLLRVLFVAALSALFLRASFAAIAPARSATVVLCGLIVLSFGNTWSPPVHAELPDAAMLEELKRRLLLPPECLPSCAEIGRLRAEIRDNALTVWLEVHADRAVAAPLPGRADQWTPQTVTVDGEPSSSLFHAGDGSLWVALTAGVHQVLLAGPSPSRTTFQLPFALVPQRLEIAATGWTVDGLRADGSSESQLIFTRIAQFGSQQALEALEATALPGFFQVERTLHLGLDWHASTRVIRLSPLGAAATLAIPLLSGESVTTPEIQVTAGKVAVNLAADQNEFAWESVLTKTESLTLSAPPTTEWVESWRADISPLWHAEISGIPVVHHQNEGGQWLPQWQPWPAETVTLALSRPQGVDGRTLTIDRSSLRLQPGQRTTEASLDFGLRSSQGGQHTMTLPQGASLQTIAINGVPQPLRQEGRALTLPIVPGDQKISMTWRSDEGIRAALRAPAWSLGSESVNAALTVTLPQDRWTLWVRGPQLGPAVLIWGVLLVIVLIAFGLGRTRLTPLTGWQWGLLGIGLSQTTVINALIVVGWLFALGLRQRLPTTVTKTQFNLVQIGLAVLSFVALSMLFEAIRQGLLGAPNMQIGGNGSNAYELNWFQDRASTEYPTVSVWSVSLWFYRGLMLAWALWLAFALLAWLRWGWSAFARDGLWRSVKLLSTTRKDSETPIMP
ncbi:MAG: hypothetical protein EXR86_04535 [Gammaproteobacteria bacterium]|nr:hypothetical protein [Gammaproteobacteria bacterium]